MELTSFMFWYLFNPICGKSGFQAIPRLELVFLDLMELSQVNKNINQRRKVLFADNMYFCCEYTQCSFFQGVHC